MGYEWFISLRYLKAKRKQTFISLITWISIGGVAVGVTALIVVLAVMTGMQEDLKQKILGANSHVIVTHAGSAGIKDYQRIIDTAKSVKGVVDASPFVFNQVMLISPTRVSGVAMRGIDVKLQTQSIDLGKYMTDGKLSFIDDKYIREINEPDDLGVMVEKKQPGIIIGRELAYNLRVHMGDTLQVVSPLGKMTPVGNTPISREFYVAGIFHAGMYEYDSSLALISLRQAQLLFNMGANITGVEVKVDDIYKAPEIADEINGKLGYPFTARDWRQLNQNLFFALALEKTVIGIILTLIVCVAAFNIISTLIMVVMEKSRDIAILKAMGASRKSVMRIFFLEGLIIGLSGTIIGDIGGVILCALLDKYQFIKLPQDVYNLDTLPVQMQMSDVVTVSVVALLITVIATIYPSWSASRLDPAEALRYE